MLRFLMKRKKKDKKACERLSSILKLKVRRNTYNCLLKNANFSIKTSNE